MPQVVRREREPAAMQLPVAQKAPVRARIDQLWHPGPHRLRELQRVLRPKYSAAGLESVLHDVFGDLLLGESRVPLVIPSFELGENTVYLFKTPIMCG